MEKPIITFASWGNYTLAFKALFEKLGLEVVPPEKTNSLSLAQGAEITPETFCFPMKVNVGSYLAALKKGANTIFMVQNVGGSCRQRYYGIIQDKVLKESGWKINFIDFKATPKDILSKLKALSGASYWQLFQAARLFFRRLWLIEEIEKKAQCLRPREIEKGKTDKILQWAFLQLEKKDSGQSRFQEKKKVILKKLSEIEIRKNEKTPKVGIIGEIYTVCDSSINFDIEKKLGEEGLEVHREMDITYHIKKLLFPWEDWLMQRKIKPYLQSTVGGHGRDAIYEMLNYVKLGFDGIIHLLPFGCMPEVTIRPILEKIHQESGIPFLSVSLDEQVAEAGIDTRLEAFVDVVKNHYNQKNL